MRAAAPAKSPQAQRPLRTHITRSRHTSLRVGGALEQGTVDPRPALRCTAPQLPHRCTALLALAGLLSPAAPARADAWQLDPVVELQASRNSNQDLVTPSHGAVDIASLSAGLTAARADEVSRTSVDIGLRRQVARGPGRNDGAESRLALAQGWTLTHDVVDLTLQTRQDSTYAASGAVTSNGAVDYSLGRGGRRATSAQARWNRSLEELSSLSLQLTNSRTRYASQLEQAADYGDRAATLGLSRRVSEVASVNAQLTRSDFDTLDGNSNSRTISYSFGSSGAFSETSSFSVGLGLDHSRSSNQVSVLVCPLQPALCRAGLVAPVQVQQRGESSRWSRQYSAGWTKGLGEVDGFNLAASHRISPSGLGSTVLSTNLSAALSHGFGPTVSGRLAYSRSRTEFPGVARPPRPGLQNLDASLSHQLSPTLSLSAGWARQRADEPRAGYTASSDTIALTLRNEWTRIEFTR
jgi:hypothetical protein